MAEASWVPQTTRPVIMGSQYMVSAGHYAASLAATRVLDAGGNAVDAGVAAGLCLNVTQPDLTNIGGSRRSACTWPSRSGSSRSAASAAGRRRPTPRCSCGIATDASRPTSGAVWCRPPSTPGSPHCGCSVRSRWARWRPRRSTWRRTASPCTR
ncbi:MAG: hypothetical protein GEV07_24755 [Streptosporangiales bacterium]|nr:hypothetical protein [Streptosporangiales bacterium]